MDAETGERVVERLTPEGWFALYGFDDAWVGDPDIAAANHVTATWERAPFRDNLMVAGYDGATRIGLFNRALTEAGPEGGLRRTLEGPGELAQVLAGRLRLGLDPHQLDAVWARIAGR